MYVVYSEKCLEYLAPGHVEAPDRVYRTYNLLKAKGFKFNAPQPCTEDELRLVHSEEFIGKIKEGEFFDPDTPNLPSIYDYAKLSAGSAVKSMETALKGETAFSLMRPPGHHAGVDGRALGAGTLGFCYFNNIAVACKKALSHVEKVAIIDIDCHHGNGTQEIFLGDLGVLFVSLHRFGFMYPGTGGVSEGNCLNYPFRHSVEDVEYLEVLGAALGEVERFDPDLVGVSAGFDGHKYDPIHAFGLCEEAYTEIGRMISGLERNTFAVLEGGYGRRMPECVHNFLIGLEQT
ncbi:MAG: histone deacetylase [Candidatus Bathyarchaeota archaeon]|nr:histone deacetylase [Candidatus Bathyarchaeota archaeon]